MPPLKNKIVIKIVLEVQVEIMAANEKRQLYEHRIIQLQVVTKLTAYF